MLSDLINDNKEVDSSLETRKCSKVLECTCWSRCISRFEVLWQVVIVCVCVWHSINSAEITWLWQEHASSTSHELCAVRCVTQMFWEGRSMNDHLVVLFVFVACIAALSKTPRLTEASLLLESNPEGLQVMCECRCIKEIEHKNTFLRFEKCIAQLCDCEVVCSIWKQMTLALIFSNAVTFWNQASSKFNTLRTLKTLPSFLFKLD